MIRLWMNSIRRRPTARVGLADDEDVRIPLHLARKHDLLLVATGEIGRPQPVHSAGEYHIWAIFSSASLRIASDVQEHAVERARVMVVTEDRVFALSNLSTSPT